MRDWQAAGVWDQIHPVLLTKLPGADRIDFSRAIIDSASVRAVGAGAQTGPKPTDRDKPGSKHHGITDARGVPLATAVTAANCPEVTQLLPLVDTSPRSAGNPGDPRCRPDKVLGDRGYDSDPHRRELRRRGIEPILAQRRTPHGSGLGGFRWFVERTLSWYHQFRRLRVRYERIPEIHEAFVTIASAIICFRFLHPGFC